MDLPRPLGPFTLLRRLAVGGMSAVYVSYTHVIGGLPELVPIHVLLPPLSEAQPFLPIRV